MPEMTDLSAVLSRIESSNDVSSDVPPGFAYGALLNDANYLCATISNLLDQLTAADKRETGLRKSLVRLVGAVDALIGDSEGVAGLHLNGDVATWQEITAGGRFEDWLLELEDARTALATFPADGGSAAEKDGADEAEGRKL